MVRPIRHQVGLEGLRVIAVATKDSTTSVLVLLTPIAFALGGMPWIMLFFWAVTLKIYIARRTKQENLEQAHMVNYKTAAGHEEIQIHGSWNVHGRLKGQPANSAYSSGRSDGGESSAMKSATSYPWRGRSVPEEWFTS